jgi:hypothetical protein
MLEPVVEGGEFVDLEEGLQRDRLGSWMRWLDAWSLLVACFVC